MNSSTETDSQVWNYHLLRAALNRFQQVPADLDEDSLAVATRVARRSLQIESLALSSEEARDMPLGEHAIESALKEIEGKYEEREDYLADLKRNGLDEAGMRTALDRELRFNAVMDRVAARSARINDLDVQLYYHMHQEQLSQPETRTARQILITVNEDFPENTADAALDRIKLIAKRVINKPKRFAEQAGKHSECPTAMNGGLLGRIPRGQLYPELDEALFEMDEGTISPVIESELGYHLLFCEQIHPEGPPPYKEAEPAIRERLAKRQRKLCQQGWLSKLAQQQADNTKPVNVGSANEPRTEASAHG
ncbi:MAG: nitrogen fixation protein NifM [Gammaproteobacteria bacterium]